MQITAVIVEDETAAREALKSYLGKYCPSVQIIGEAEHIKEAVPMIHERQPQLVFLDVEMPFGNAFDVLEACKDLQFETIFVTAFSEYSLRALNMSAAYYLLKPVSIDELITAVHKVQEHIVRKEIMNRNQIILDNFREKVPGRQTLILPTTEGFEVVKLTDIVRFKANGNFTDVHLADGSKKMVCRFLKHFEDMLSQPFMRVHKSYMINLNYVKSYHRSAGGYAVMTDGAEVEISGGYKEAFLERFR
jgi:two-component system, LytTR family, response regulator